jgi:hypothetical protein
MKNLTRIVSLTLGLMVSLTSIGFAQKGNHGGNGNGNGNGNHGGKGNGNRNHENNQQGKVNHHNRKNVKRSVYRPTTIVVYHPNWAPKRNYNRRWVYFPGHNFYWDNWRQIYVYRNGNVWISNPNPPSFIININLGAEKHYELKEDDDDTDDIYNNH